MQEIQRNTRDRKINKTKKPKNGKKTAQKLTTLQKNKRTDSIAKRKCKDNQTVRLDPDIFNKFQPSGCKHQSYTKSG